MIEINDLVDQLEEAEEPVYNLFNPNHREYEKINALLQRIRRTPDEISRDLIEANRVQPESGEEPESSQAPSVDPETQAIADTILNFFRSGE